MNANEQQRADTDKEVKTSGTNIPITSSSPGYTAGYTLTYEEWLDMYVADPVSYGGTKEQTEEERRKYLASKPDSGKQADAPVT